QNASGGRASLKLNLDGSGSAENAGTLWARNFYIVGGELVREVASQSGFSEGAFPSRENSQRRGRGQPAGERRELQMLFDQLYVPFTVGEGQLTVFNAFINGPAMGATLRGRVNLGQNQIQLGGTYVPLYGINSALGGFPIIGDLFVSRRGEGLLGMTYAIQGALKNPDVVINPVSIVAPGIFRQIFEYRPPPPPPGIPGALRGVRAGTVQRIERSAPRRSSSQQRPRAPRPNPNAATWGADGRLVKPDTPVGVTGTDASASQVYGRPSRGGQVTGQTPGRATRQGALRQQGQRQTGAAQRARAGENDLAWPEAVIATE
ncbi:MAG: AsmA-like C-terminal region-containing protein, partial [Pseudomonadota bacterium]